MKHFTLRTAHLASLLFLFSASALLAANPTGSAKVLAVEGTAAAYDEGSSQGQPLGPGDILQEGTSISTGTLSTVDLVFSNGSMLTLEENTSLTLTELKQQAYGGTATYESLQADPSQSQTLLDLNYGKVSGEVKNLRPGSTFNVDSPLGTAAIRGTIFTVEIRYNAQRGEFLLIVRNLGGDVTVISRYLGQFEYGEGNIGDKGYDSSLSDDSEEPIPDEHTVVIRLSRSDPYFDDLIDFIRNLEPGRTDFPIIFEIPAPEFTPDDPSTQVVSPEGPENGNGPPPD